jgi:hypothetical protein
VEKPSEPVLISRPYPQGSMSRQAGSASDAGSASAPSAKSAPPAPPAQAAAPSAASPAGEAAAESGTRERLAKRAESADRATAPSALASRSAEKLGTAHGQREYSQVTRTAFERLSNLPQWVEEIRYDSRDNLVAAGVLAPSDGVLSGQARAFPLSEGPRYVPDYVPDPPSR